MMYMERVEEEHRETKHEREEREMGERAGFQAAEAPAQGHLGCEPYLFGLFLANL